MQGLNLTSVGAGTAQGASTAAEVRSMAEVERARPCVVTTTPRLTTPGFRLAERCAEGKRYLLRRLRISEMINDTRQIAPP
jgi:hypothetical protein